MEISRAHHTRRPGSDLYNEPHLHGAQTSADQDLAVDVGTAIVPGGVKHRSRCWNLLLGEPMEDRIRTINPNCMEQKFPQIKSLPYNNFRSARHVKQGACSLWLVRFLVAPFNRGRRFKETAVERSQGKPRGEPQLSPPRENCHCSTFWHSTFHDATIAGGEGPPFISPE